MPQHNATFARAPRDPASAFVPLGPVDLDAILCHEEERVVARDNTVTLGGRVLQIAAQPGRRSCVGLTVTVRHHLDGGFTIARGTQRLATFHADGQPVPRQVLRRGRIENRPSRMPQERRSAGRAGLVSPGSHGEPTPATV